MAEGKFIRALGLTDSTMIVAGSMIGSGIFIVSADIARTVGSPGWLLAVWAITGVLTITAALSYGELAAMMPRAGGQYVYLREAYSPLWGFLYGWTLFMVIQTGTIAAVAVAFAKFLGVLAPQISAKNHFFDFGSVSILGRGMSVSLSSQQAIAMVVIALLTWTNTRGIKTGKAVQDVFTITKVGALLCLIALGFLLGRNSGAAVHTSEMWSPAVSGTVLGGAALLAAVCTAMVGSLFSSDAWNNVTFTAGEVVNPKRNLPLSLLLGTTLVTLLYVLANLVYVMVLPLSGIQGAPEDRVGTAAAQVIFGESGTVIMAVAIMISTFGCENGLILAGARVYYAMARDGLFFRGVGSLNASGVPASALLIQGVWAGLLTLTGTYGQLLDYVVFSAVLFYVLTVGGIFVLRKKRPEVPRPYRAFGYPIIPAAYMVTASVVLIELLIHKPNYTWPGLIIVLAGIPVFYVWKRWGTPIMTVASSTAEESEL